MSSPLIVPVTKVISVKNHPNADCLSLVEVLGWQTCSRRNEFVEGDEVVYFAPDCVLPQELSDVLGVTSYLSNGRVKQIRLRGEPSFGFAVQLQQIKKYLPKD